MNMMKQSHLIILTIWMLITFYGLAMSMKLTYWKVEVDKENTNRTNDNGLEGK